MKDAANLQNHRLSLTFGERIFENEDHLIHPTIREQDSEERFKVIGQVAGKSFTGVFVWHDDPPRCISVRGATMVKNELTALPADQSDSEDGAVTYESLDRGHALA